MTNTIPNVPRELLADLLGNDHNKRIMAERHLLAMLANATSPAGEDGLEVVAWLCEWMGDKCGGVYSGLSKTSLEGLRRSQGEDVLIVSDEPLCRLSDAAAIIAGLRGEVERLQMQLAACGVVALANTIESAGEARQMNPDYMSASCSDVAGAVDREIALRTERAQQAQRIGELASHLEFAVTLLTVAGLAGNAQVEAMRAALSADHEPKQCT